MFYWISFIITALFFCYVSLEKKLSDRVRKISQGALILVLVYFSAFRDGLGQDYENYYNYLMNGVYNKFSLIEPGYSLFSNIVYFTRLSPVFFFLIMALVTNYLFIKSFYRYRNTFLIVFIYLTGSIFYFQTFNAVRQMFAVSVFMYWGVQFIENRKLFYFLTSVLLAASIHISALFLIPVYFIVHRNYSNKILMTILLASYIIGQIIKYDLASLFGQYITLYQSYSETDIIGESGYLTLFFNLILILLIYNKKRNMDIKSIIPFNLFFIGVLLYNLIPSFFFISRFAIYFIMFAPIVLPALSKVFPKRVWALILVLGYSIMFILFLFTNLDNPKIIPNEILDLNSIFDY